MLNIWKFIYRDLMPLVEEVIEANGLELNVVTKEGVIVKGDLVDVGQNFIVVKENKGKRKEHLINFEDVESLYLLDEGPRRWTKEERKEFLNNFWKNIGRGTDK